MKIYFLRHAPTAPNLTGAMVQDYSQEPIAGTLPEHFEEDIRPYLPKLDINTPVICSPAKRCVQTVEKIFGIQPMMQVGELNEFDCKELEHLKFWEVTQEEFEKIVPLRATDMEKQIDIVFKFFNTLHDTFENINNIVCVSHGMVIRYIYHYLTGNKAITPYDVINSKGFKFYNLDLLVYDTETNEVEAYHNRDHITHF